MIDERRSQMTLKVIIAGGGTGGHVYPGLAVVERIRQSQPDAQIVWVGNPNKAEARIIPAESIEFRPIHVRGLSRSLNPAEMAKNIGALFQAAGAMRESKMLISSFKPDFAIGTGGYVCGPPIAQAARMGVPTFLIEPNSYPGLTVRWLSKRVDRIFLGTEDAMQHLGKANCIVTGTPVRKAVIAAKRNESIPALGLLKNKPCLVIVGGSLGAEKINEALFQFVELAIKEERQLLSSIQIFHQTGGKGPKELDGLRWGYPEADYVKVDYIDRMELALASADLIVSRAGAATLSEICARGIPSILIPFPHSAEGHQLKNAHMMRDRGASLVIEDYQLTGKSLFDAVIPLMKDEAKRRYMGAKAIEMHKPECLDQIYAEIMNVLEEKGKRVK